MNEAECWIWQNALNKDGYGRFYVGPNCEPRQVFAHRWAYELKYGPIPKELEMDHLCRVASCVNPDHLEAITHQENIKRGDHVTNNANSRKTHCIHGHSLSGRNLKYWYSLSKLKFERYCQACQNRHNHKYWAKWYAKQKAIEAKGVELSWHQRHRAKQKALREYGHKGVNGGVRSDQSR